jgi:hypothetical protein
MLRTIRVPSYRLHKASGQAVVVLGGRSHYLGKFGTADSKAEYQRLTGEWLANSYRIPAAGAESEGLKPPGPSGWLGAWSGMTMYG